MKILLFHPVRLPPKDYGGVERVVLWLSKALLEEGHDVWVAALEGSELPKGVRLVPMQLGQCSAVDLLPKLPDGIDVVHFQAPPEKEAIERLQAAAITTIHGNGKPGEIFLKNTVFLSRDHARRHGAQVFVYNGVDPSEYQFSPSDKDGRYLFLSKTSWKVKNVSAAVRRCARARAGLRVSGGSRPFSKRLRVALTPGMSWEGPVAGEKKAKLLARAKGLVFPILWPEPFGLVVIEALISGTPVLASRLGSLPELVASDVGVLLTPDDDAAWIEWLSKDRLPFLPERCRAWALDHFSSRKMAQNYLELYRQVVSGKSLHADEPKTLLDI